MATRAIETMPRTVPLRRTPPIVVDALLMVAVALGLRCWWFGNPIVQVDEQFYLLVGDRMLHGAVPFVDIWDRKPVGLFLAYAAMRLLGGNGIIQYQLVAAACAAAQALLVVQVARLHAGAFGARVAGVAVLLWLLVYDGAGGQSPVIYGPLVAGAALITLRLALPDRLSAGHLAHGGGWAMLLAGLAIQIKYTALFEGIGFGCLLLHVGWRRGQGWRTLAGQALAWIAIALAPTALAFAWYAQRGDGQAFLYANFLSIGARGASTWRSIAHHLFTIAALALPLLACAVAALRSPARDGEARRARRLIAAWLVAALVGFSCIGTFSIHYFLPVLLPLAALGAPALGHHPRWRAAPAVAVLAIGAIMAVRTGTHRHVTRGSEQSIAAAVNAIRPRLTSCLFIFDGDPILYYLTRSCIPTRYAFPDHLNRKREVRALGTDPVAEVRRVVAGRPSVIISADRPDRDGNPAAWAVMRAALARDYRPIFAAPFHRRVQIVYALKRDA